MNKYALFFLLAILSFHADATQSFLRPVSFPTTSSDTSFSERVENATHGYAPFQGTSAYAPLKIESEEEFISRMVHTAQTQQQRDKKTMTRAEYCSEYPLDSEHCPQAPGLYESIVAIGDKKPSTSTPPVPGDAPVQTTPSVPGGPTTPTHKRTYGATCTPPQHSNIFANKILTTGRYATIDPAFEKAMITTFRAEGDCVNDPDDSGGYTCYGVSQKNNPEIDVRNITRADAEDIAYTKYYTQYNINKLPDDSRGNVFMLGWGGGTITGIHRFCKFLNIPEHNTIDDTVVSAAENYPGDIHNDFLDEQQRFYIEIANRGNNKKYLKGWMNRIRLMRENGCNSPTTNPISR